MFKKLAVFGVASVLILLAGTRMYNILFPTLHSVGGENVVVEPGQTLWSIAKQYYPNDDPRFAYEEIEKANHMSDTASLIIGQQLLLP